MEKTVLEMRSWLDENRGNYEEAMSKLSDPKFVRMTMASIRSWLADIMGYNPVNHSGDVAVFIIGRAQVRFAGLIDDLDFIAQFEEEKSRFKEAVKELEAEENS